MSAVPVQIPGSDYRLPLHRRRKLINRVALGFL